jgi:Uma2 family endonuclease
MTVTLSEDPARLGSTTVAELRSAIEDLVGDRAKVELLGGEVIVSPLARTLHDRIVSRLEHAIYDKIGDDIYDLTQRVEFVVDEANSPQPDLAIMDAALRSDTLEATEYAAKEALLVVEVTSPSNAVNDRKRGLKYKAYAKGLVPICLLIDPHAETGPSLTLFTQPNGTRYQAETTVPFGTPLRLPEPFDAVTIDSSRFPVPKG